MLLQELDLFTECCIQCESLFIIENNERAAAIVRDCADMNVLLTEFIKRRSEIEMPLMKGCIDSWIVCQRVLKEHLTKPEMERCYDVCNMCIEDFKNYI